MRQLIRDTFANISPGQEVLVPLPGQSVSAEVEITTSGLAEIVKQCDELSIEDVQRLRDNAQALAGGATGLDQAGRQGRVNHGPRCTVQATPLYSLIPVPQFTLS